MLIKSARSMGLGPITLFRKVILPAAVPTILTGIRLAGAYSILVLLIAEMVGAKAGLGYLINDAQAGFRIPEMYAGIITISVRPAGHRPVRRTDPVAPRPARHPVAAGHRRPPAVHPAQQHRHRGPHPGRRAGHRGPGAHARPPAAVPPGPLREVHAARLTGEARPGYTYV
jgi:hypothetical protein